jgi:hypothetical protein
MMMHKVVLGGTPVDLVGPEAALDVILARTAGPGVRQLAVARVNLDHLHHFGTGGRWAGTLHSDPARNGSADVAVVVAGPAGG